MSAAAAGNLTGGCQCGAVRFRAERLGRASICHCRMCQKHFGGFYGPLVTAHELTWTRGAPKWFQSSNRAQRGFCGSCGTPLVYLPDDAAAELAIGAFDDPAVAAPTIQVNPADELPFVHTLHLLPMRPDDESPRAVEFYASIVSYQHPDHDTTVWPPRA